jgi:hypothetical protein
MVAVAMIDQRLWYNIAYPLYALALSLLVAVDVLGEINKGAQRWLDLGVVQLQPSEIMKVALVLALARYFHSAYLSDVGRPLYLIPPLAMIAAPVFLVLVQPDLGTAVMLGCLGRGPPVHGRRADLEVPAHRRPRRRRRCPSPGRACTTTSASASTPSSTRRTTRSARATTSSSRRSRWARAASGARASSTAARPSSTTCPRSRPTSRSR